MFIYKIIVYVGTMPIKIPAYIFFSQDKAEAFAKSVNRLCCIDRIGG